MKVLKAVAVCALLAISSQSFANTAKPIQIIFPKGETCHDFNTKVGKKPNQTFVLALTDSQQLSFQIQSNTKINIHITDPNQKPLTSVGELIDFYPTIYLYEPTITGLHSISFTTKNKSSAKIDVRVCADENLF
ncbi:MULTISPECIES: hypothetical protein [Moraxella]|jgi:hypothetical protein|uniref:Uncharacterized protein n=1 Tax=Moraxella lacunata TaxID=477 RepID=A0A1B8PW20_MORLA|nr:MULTISPECIES: hypothetical protein [Moraxella]MBE9579711.1 hypothetical protein [Moraxella sp. K1664]MBE9589022.1 hypothetical protein [Moraxella sp. K1630]MBE9591459.1 hypothetical protein [Moraxella sp. K127]MBE9597280.1 hypothetical protein [Moraxella sp. K2450]MDH9219755.1 hypothetical protein [Moraxella lacunata]